MRYYKNLQNEYLIAIGTGYGGEEITEAEYQHIADIIANRPVQSGFGHRLRTDLTWEQYKLPVVEDPELSDEEVLEILFGGKAQ